MDGAGNLDLLRRMKFWQEAYRDFKASTPDLEREGHAITPEMIAQEKELDGISRRMAAMQRRLSQGENGE